MAVCDTIIMPTEEAISAKCQIKKLNELEIIKSNKSWEGKNWKEQRTELTHQNITTINGLSKLQYGVLTLNEIRSM